MRARRADVQHAQRQRDVTHTVPLVSLALGVLADTSAVHTPPSIAVAEILLRVTSPAP